MRRGVLVLAGMALALVLASGVALAVTKVGTNGPDFLRGTNKADNLLGRGGNDQIFGEGGHDNLLGGPGKDFMLTGNERLAGAGDTNLVGGAGNDAVVGGFGSDNVVGNEGNDFLIGGPGLHPREAPNDKLLGADGNDVFDVLNSPAAKDVVLCGRGFDRVSADREDVIAPDCEKVFIGLGSQDAFFESIPESFFEGLNPEILG
jgi:Ca2+-binding RTX toxin-like protein